MRKGISILFICIAVIVFFWQFFAKGLLPIPADTITGLYHPFRDLYAKEYPNGIPFKNFLITDPVRQQYPWRELVISAEKKLELPLWNPYNFSGTPLLANFQSGAFSLSNVLFFLMPFPIGWSLIIFLGPLLSGIFLYLYLDNLKLNKWASLLGAFTFSFSGFFVSWLEWGTITQVGLWLPLILLSIDKLISNKENLKWIFVFLFSLTFSFFAGHLQIFFYLFVFSWIYFLARWFQFGRKKNILFIFLLFNLLFLIVTSIQWITTLQLIFLSARNVDVIDFNNPGWFIPWQNLIQFISPDFFGNPTTLNYWGVWNYGELVGYVGIAPLILAIFAMFYRRDKKTLFFGTILFLSLIFAFPTFFAKIPYILKIPLFDTAQPTRLLFIIDFVLAVLAALGFDYLLKTNKKNAIIYPLIFIAIVLAGLWVFIPKEHFSVVKSNLLLPTFLFVSSLVLFFILIIVRKKNKLIRIICMIIIVITVFDLFRFGWKFIPFTQKDYLFPSTKTLAFLQKNLGNFRIMTTDSRILPPNFSVIYKLQSVDGYDPLYLLRYGALIAASERQKADIKSPFGFNRIITPHNYESKIMDLLGVKYIISLSVINSSKLTQVFQEGKTIVYENKDVTPRAFFVKNLFLVKDNNDEINKLFQEDFDPIEIAVSSDARLNRLATVDAFENKKWSLGKVTIEEYSENKIIIDTENDGEGFLVLTDSFYPSWHARITNSSGNKGELKIYETDYNFRGIIVPSGKNKIEFYNSLF